MQGQPTKPADKALILAAIDAKMADGKALRAACVEVGLESWGKPLNHNNYYRWKAEAEGLKPARVAGVKGRPVKFDLTGPEAARLRFWALVKDSVPLAVEAFIAEAMPHDDAHPYFRALREALQMCPDHGEPARPELAEALRAHWQAAVKAGKPVVWPGSIARAARVTEQERALFRGRKAFSSAQGTERKGGFIIDEGGKKIPWLPGMIWESDDMSLNEPFRFHDSASGQDMTGRQMLATIDACALFWLGHDLIGRDRDSYRSEDIADHFRKIVEIHGLPYIWRIEKGRWDNRFIWGLTYGKNEDGSEKRWGGLDAIIHIRAKHESRGKANVEGGFDLLQAILAHGFNGAAQSIGRSQGEFERETRSMLRANRDNPDLYDLGKFWGIEQASEAMARAMHLFNTRPKQRHNFDNKTIVPADVWAQHVKRPCPQAEMWRFCAIKTKVTVRRGIVEARAPHYPNSFRFRLQGGHRTPNCLLDNGHEVFIAFTPGQAWEGCHVFNADSSARNRDGYGFGEKIGVAEWMMDAPQEDLSGHGHSTGAKRAAGQVVRASNTIFNGSHFRGRRVSHAQDTLGNISRADSNTPPSPERNPRPTDLGAGEDTAGVFTPRARPHPGREPITDADGISRRARGTSLSPALVTIDEEEEAAAMRL